MKSLFSGILLIMFWVSQGVCMAQQDTVVFSNCPDSIPLTSTITVDGMPNVSYYVFEDHAYSKLYIEGYGMAILDYRNNPNIPEVTLHGHPPNFMRIQRGDSSIYNDKIYFATAYQGGGIFVVDRDTGAGEVFDPLQGEGIDYLYQVNNDVLVDVENGLLYSTVFFANKPTSERTDLDFYGLLEYNLNTDQKRWINENSIPVNTPPVLAANDVGNWNVHRLYLDKVENRLYFTTGYGIWWWDRDNDATGVFDTDGGLPLASGEAQLPSNLVTHLFIDRTENKMYIGTHNGLFVWDRNNSTSTIYNKDNSVLDHNLVNHMSKYEEENLLFVAMEYGGLFQLNTVTGEQRLFKKGVGNEIDPQLTGNGVSSANFDPISKKLYVSLYDGAVWVRDYGNKVARPLALVTSDMQICSGASVPLVVGGNNLNVHWESYSPSPSLVVTPDSTTTYSYTVEDGYGCTANGDVTVTVLDTLKANILPISAVCPVDSTTLEAEEVSGASYSWQPGGLTGRTVTVAADKGTEYTLTVTNGAGCISTDHTFIPLKTITVASEDVTICVSDSAILSATGADNYSWSTGDDTSQITFAPSSSGEHILTVTGYRDGCIDTDTVIVTVEPYCPGSPVSFLARALSTTEIELTWGEPEGNHSEYIIEKKNGSGVYEAVATVPLGTTVWNDIDLEPETDYYYRIFSEVGNEHSAAREGHARTFTPNENYVMETEVLVEGVKDVEDVPNLDYDSRNSVWSYMNGLGSDMQTVIEAGSPSMHDVIQPIIYDARGLRTRQYLSYTVDQPNEPGNYRAGAETEVLNFYASPPAAVAATAFPYSYTQFDNTPENKVLEQASPGEAWEVSTGHTVKIDNNTNGSEDVINWEVNSFGELIGTGYYTESQLTKTTTTTADDETVSVYKDMYGRTLKQEVPLSEGLKITYYVYNDKGSVTHRITPTVVDNLSGGPPYTINYTTVLADCYSYQYDDQERLISEKWPDKERVIYIYDKWDRLVLSQTGNQKIINQWSFTKYDRLNRAIMSGLLDTTVALGQNAMKAVVDAHYAKTSARRYETYEGNNAGNIHGYSCKSYPIVTDGQAYMSVSYYDSYTFIDDITGFTNAYAYDESPSKLNCETLTEVTYCFPNKPFNILIGQLTGSKTRVVNKPDWLHGVIYYDDKGRTIQAVTENYSGGIDRVSSLYNYSDWLLATYKTLIGPDGAVYGIKRRYTYDHTGRLKAGYHQLYKNGIDQSGEVFLAENLYNELGQLIEKNLNIENGIPLQSIDYRYNIQGWLKSINDPGLSEVPGKNEDDDNLDLFGMDFFYNERLMGVPAN